MNKNHEEAMKMLQIWKETVTFLEGKFRGLHSLVGVISEEADIVIDKHKFKVRNDLNFAYEKIEQYEQEFLNHERQEG